jgi:hypothetical protein
MAQYLNDNDVPHDDNDFEDEDENLIPSEDIIYSLTSHGGNQMIINEREIFRQTKCSRKRNSDGVFGISWKCKDNDCTGRISSQRHNVTDFDINARLTEGTIYVIFLVFLYLYLNLHV